MNRPLISYKGTPMGEDTVVFGEVGLTGEIRSVQNAAKRVTEAKKLGFRKVILPINNLKECMTDGIELVGIRHVFELFRKTK